MNRSYTWTARPAILALLGSLALVCTPVFAQKEVKPQPPAVEPVYTLEIKGAEEPALKSVVEALLKDFQDAYPRLIKRFANPDWPAPKKIVLTFEKGLNHPAHASGNALTFSTEWFLKHPDDLGVLTHELTHIVQHYRRGGPGWLVEGIADYSRFLYGAGPGWKLPDRVRPQDSYLNSYRITARFLLWVEKKYTPTFVDKCNRKLQEGKFAVEEIKSLTGKTVEDLWKEYAEDTAFKPELPTAAKEGSPVTEKQPEKASERPR